MSCAKEMHPPPCVNIRTQNLGLRVGRATRPGGYMRIDGLVVAMAGKYFKSQSLAVPQVPQAVPAVHVGPREGDPQPKARAEEGKAVTTKSYLGEPGEP